MQARGPLMIEHRLIERMIKVIQKAIVKIEAEKAVDPILIDTAVDFIRFYADRTHHGKEEDIMFRDLAKKKMNEKDGRIMKELLGEHVFGRKTTKALVEANARYRKGDKAAWADIVKALKTLADFYPIHIAKEDKVFFPAARAYVTDQEDQKMLEEFWEFDRKVIHEKYMKVVEALE